MDTPALEQAVLRHLTDDGPRYGLDPSTLTAHYVLNPGGFINHSFRVTDGERTLHVKLTDDEDMTDFLAQWWRLRRPLEARYRAPRVLAWLELPEVGLAGLLSQWVDGAPPEKLEGTLRGEVVAAVTALHRDGELAAGIGAPARPCRATLREYTLARLAGELRPIAAAGLPFVDASTVRWMGGEVARLAALAEASPAFGLPGGAPLHGDLWLQNFLVTPGGAWCLLDWDLMWLGDPAHDWAALLKPPPETWGPVAWGEALPGLAGEPGLIERLEVYERASLLDSVIDPLANYLEAGVAPGHAPSVRAACREQHLVALERYREHFG